MTIESSIFDTISGLVGGRVFPDVAPLNTDRPFITYQQIGGESIRYADNTADSRFPTIQVSVWSRTRMEASTMIQQIEDALCASSAFQASPQGEPISTHERETGLYGSIQRFDVFGPR